MSNEKILIVEDENDIGTIIKLHLESQGYQANLIEDGNLALDHIQQNENEYKLYILDRMLPGSNGVDICKFLRNFKPTKNSPILMVTALTSPDQIVEGLDAGADDYLTKPFDNNVLLARVRALLRRGAGQSTQVTNNDNKNVYIIQDLKVDLDQCKSWIDNKELELTLSEYKLLCIFMGQPGKVFTRKYLVSQIQDGNVHVTDRTIDTHIFGLRKKLSKYSSLIETIRGVGYRIQNEV